MKAGAYVSTTLDADVDTAWSVVHDFHGMPAWTPRVRASLAECGSGAAAVGSIRCLTLAPDGRQVRERLVDHDTTDRRYSYEFVGTIPYPVTSYRGTIHLLPITETGATFLEWSGAFDAEPAQVESLRVRFAAVYTAFIADLRAHLATR
ncbi:SRPBCC family protein [Pseudonocardia sp. GCM10023141]|uniref:SRPBCC family protein n=1 Tax=Pseudonocardia sp. GCM10023141 TaxID=3252653 RepID=UPI00360DE2AF